MPIQYINLPQVPDNIIKRLAQNYKEYTPTKLSRDTIQKAAYIRSLTNVEIYREWCNENIAMAPWSVQLMDDDIPIHKDINGVRLRLTYLIDAGGDDVLTRFYNDDRSIIESHKIELFRWHLFDTTVFHDVVGIEADRYRFAITASILALPKLPK